MTGETRFHIAALGSAFAGDLPSWMVRAWHIESRASF